MGTKKKLQVMDLKKIEEGFRLILDGTGEDLSREGLKDTPKRAARLWVHRNFGYSTELKVMSSPERNKKTTHGRVIPITVFHPDSLGLLIRKVTFNSLCEHHLADIKGECWVGIIPKGGGYLLGMNKIDKIVKWFAARLQIQENLTKQIISWITDNIKPQGVIVVIKADHQCANLQGDEGYFTTSEVSGVFASDPSARAEFLRLIDTSH